LRAASRFLRRDCTAISSQSGVAAQASQLPQRSHLEFRRSGGKRDAGGTLWIARNARLRVALPSTFFFSGIFDFADKKGVQARIFFLPKQKAIGGECVASARPASW